MTKNQQDQDQNSVLSAPGVLSSPESSGFTSIGAIDSDTCSNLISPSPSTSTSSWASALSTKKDHLTMNKPNQHQQRYKKEESLPPSPTLTAYDSRSSSTTDTTSCPYVLPPVDTTGYFANRPLPTQRRQPGRNRHSAIESSSTSSRPSSSLYNNTKPTRHSLVLEKLAYDTLTYFVDSPSESSLSPPPPPLKPSASSPSPGKFDAYKNSNDQPTSEFMEKLTSRLTATKSVHPSVLKLAEDVLAFINESPPLAAECRQLKPKLEVCLMIHGKDLD
ncbi:hypothetical protein BC941DRAFT_465248 [Chlamydoabsidia padenii]|nr:hypothetical protein BC941DRAFT_465248 [Chlamydoabsidia padenii]